MIETNNLHDLKLTFNSFKGLLNKISIIFSLVLIVWFFVTYFFADLFFEKKEKFILSGKVYEIYYNGKIDEKKLGNLISKCNLHILKIPDSRIENSKLKVRLFFCNNQNLYTFFAFMNRKGYATTSPLRNDIFISDINLEQGFASPAPQADIVVVKLKQAKKYLKDYYFIREGAKAYQENDIINAVVYISNIADMYNKPVIICVPLASIVLKANLK